MVICPDGVVEHHGAGFKNRVARVVGRNGAVVEGKCGCSARAERYAVSQVQSDLYGLSGADTAYHRTRNRRYPRRSDLHGAALAANLGINVRVQREIAFRCVSTGVLNDGSVVVHTGNGEKFRAIAGADMIVEDQRS